jgi:hypothetical protein
MKNKLSAIKEELNKIRSQIDQLLQIIDDETEGKIVELYVITVNSKFVSAKDKLRVVGANTGGLNPRLLGSLAQLTLDVETDMTEGQFQEEYIHFPTFDNAEAIKHFVRKR